VFWSLWGVKKMVMAAWWWCLKMTIVVGWWTGDGYMMIGCEEEDEKVKSSDLLFYPHILYNNLHSLLPNLPSITAISAIHQLLISVVISRVRFLIYRCLIWLTSLNLVSDLLCDSVFLLKNQYGLLKSMKLWGNYIVWIKFCCELGIWKNICF